MRATPSRRLPNSITPWMPIAAVVVYDSSVHLGQVGQPRPESVSLTAAPVTTSAMLAIRDARAIGRRAGSLTCGIVRTAVFRITGAPVCSLPRKYVTLP
jgi:hypothetical protein